MHTCMHACGVRVLLTSCLRRYLLTYLRTYLLTYLLLEAPAQVDARLDRLHLGRGDLVTKLVARDIT